jgi:RNA polymerase sigma-70 factor (ECF subfamily)
MREHPMSDTDAFEDFLRRVRAGEAGATSELVERFGPAIRLEVRMRLGEPGLRRLLDPEDICQSVLGSFFVRAAAGQYELDRPEQLVGLLLAMARNKVAMQVRRRRALRRDARRDEAADPAALELPGDEPSPSRIAIGRELLEEFRRRLSDDERRVAELRAQGQEWAEIARAVGGTADGRRKQLARAADRVARELGLEGPDDE